MEQSPLVKLPFQVPFKTQCDILNYAAHFGGASLGAYGGSGEKFWNAVVLRYYSRDLEGTLKRDPSPHYFRYRSDLEWFWLETPITKLVQDLLEPAQKLYSTMTKVTILAHRPGTKILAHRDLVPGTTYKNLRNSVDFRIGDQAGFYTGGMDKKFFCKPELHSQNGYFNMKIPLTTKEGNNGLPFIVLNGEKRYYNMGNNFFLINEVEVEHGADPVDFWRGVIFVDGIFAKDFLTLANGTPYSLEPSQEHNKPSEL